MEVLQRDVNGRLILDQLKRSDYLHAVTIGDFGLKNFPYPYFRKIHVTYLQEKFPELAFEQTNHLLYLSRLKEKQLNSSYSSYDPRTSNLDYSLTLLVKYETYVNIRPHPLLPVWVSMPTFHLNPGLHVLMWNSNLLIDAVDKIQGPVPRAFDIRPSIADTWENVYLNSNVALRQPYGIQRKHLQNPHRTDTVCLVHPIGSLIPFEDSFYYRLHELINETSNEFPFAMTSSRGLFKTKYWSFHMEPLYKPLWNVAAAGPEERFISSMSCTQS